ncbi:MAG: tripartite tricarboxylate transporter TctB family protein [Betaproteobacteria bacterium]|nr:tripartite tricarboxylate transporter TctB family protein [Betaproteobacteria bacterium]
MMANRITFCFTVVLAAIYLYATEQFPALHLSDPLGPQAFPRLLGIGLVLTAIALLIETLRTRKSAGAAEEGRASGEARYYAIVVGATIWTGLYFAAFEWLGYAISTSIYLLALMAYFRRGKWISNGLTSMVYSFGSYVIFTKLLLVSLPAGLLPL